MLADIVLILHFVYVLGVTLPVPVIVIGSIAGWGFIRNNWFRNIHLLMSSVVVVEAAAGMVCPLTSLERLLREMAGQVTYRGSFIGHWVSKILYHDWKPWVFPLIYTLFDGFVVALYLLIPPDWLLNRRRGI
jgi:hypothetical protein